jgi:hypothetical protein
MPVGHQKGVENGSLIAISRCVQVIVFAQPNARNCTVISFA